MFQIFGNLDLRMCLKSNKVKLQSVCVRLHTVCEITQCAQNYTYIQLEKISSQLKNFTLTPWVARATNISCVERAPGPARDDRSIKSPKHEWQTDKARQ